jgi:adenosylmethionine-8-amino-7-oxononanoate aminotransferase
VDGLRGDHVLLAPPFIITGEESAIICRALKTALAGVFTS